MELRQTGSRPCPGTPGPSSSDQVSKLGIPRPFLPTVHKLESMPHPLLLTTFRRTGLSVRRLQPIPKRIAPPVGKFEYHIKMMYATYAWRGVTSPEATQRFTDSAIYATYERCAMPLVHHHREERKNPCQRMPIPAQQQWSPTPWDAHTKGPHRAPSILSILKQRAGPPAGRPMK